MPAHRVRPRRHSAEFDPFFGYQNLGGVRIRLYAATATATATATAYGKPASREQAHHDNKSRK